jgi:hypothetical protein
MKYRKLRIAWSVGCGVACVLLVLLWVRSYWTWDIVSYDRPPAFVAINSLRGCVQFNGAKNPSRNMDVGWRSTSKSIEGRFPHFATTFGFAWLSSATSISVTVPHWLLISANFAIAFLPWLPWRFSLRTLLIATTLLAVVLGLIVAVLRWRAV